MKIEINSRFDCRLTQRIKLERTHDCGNIKAHEFYGIIEE